MIRASHHRIYTEAQLEYCPIQEKLAVINHQGGDRVHCRIRICTQIRRRTKCLSASTFVLWLMIVREETGNSIR